MNGRTLDDLQSEQVIEFLTYHMDMELRGKLMRELPQAYNEMCGYPVVKVVRTSDGTEV